MKKNLNMLIAPLLFVSFVLCEYEGPTNEQSNEMMKQTMQIIWEQAMQAKEAINATAPQIREELLENLCSSAPSQSFVTHADLSDELTGAENTSASVFVSTNNQSSWIENIDVGPVGTPGYESTWGATTTTDGGLDVSWYLSGFMG